jgi:hypothetical protein
MVNENASQGMFNDTLNFIENEYEQIRFTVSYIIFQRRGQWVYLDNIAQNFHLVTAGVAIFLCANWQVSLIMYAQYICAISLFLSLAIKLSKNSKI